MHPLRQTRPSVTMTLLLNKGQQHYAERNNYRRNRRRKAAPLQTAALLEDRQFALLSPSLHSSSFPLHTLKAFHANAVLPPALQTPLCIGWKQEAEEKADGKFCQSFFPFPLKNETRVGLILGERRAYIKEKEKIGMMLRKDLWVWQGKRRPSC